MSELMFDVGLAAKLKQAVIRNGTDLADIAWLCEGDNLVKVRCLRQGHAGLTVLDHVIDCDANPFVPNGWKVKEHQKGGQFKWDATKVSLWLADGQKNGEWLEGNKLCKELKGKSVYNANLLDYLLANPTLIPEEWKGKYVFFWGTIYRSSSGRLCVRYLYWHGYGWSGYCHWLVLYWRGFNPAVVPAS